MQEARLTGVPVGDALGVPVPPPMAPELQTPPRAPREDAPLIALARTMPNERAAQILQAAIENADGEALASVLRAWIKGGNEEQKAAARRAWEAIYG